MLCKCINFWTTKCKASIQVTSKMLVVKRDGEHSQECIERAQNKNQKVKFSKSEETSLLREASFSNKRGRPSKLERSVLDVTVKNEANSKNLI